LEWIDENGNDCSIDCFFENGTSKGLFNILKELKLVPHNSKSSQFLLPRLVELAKNHPAFDVSSNLHTMAALYDVNIIFLPKFHSELSPIEGKCAHEKQHIRKHTDQTFPTLRKLLMEARDNLYDHILIPKLWRRFWKEIEDYSNGRDFYEILTEHFGAKCRVGVGHRQIQPVSDKIIF
jgi:hypothetical protein